MNLKILIPSICLSLLTFISCQKNEIDEVKQNEELELLSHEEIDKRIETSLNRGEVFDWNKNDVQLIYSALTHSDHILAVGYQPSDFSSIDSKLSEIDVNSPTWTEARNKVLEPILSSLIQYNEKNELPYEIHEILPIIFLETTDENLIQNLSEMNEVRYLEPLGYQLSGTDLRSSSGCSGSPEYINPNDYSTIAPQAKLPWTYHNASIPAAWNTANGNNVGICIIDTGGSKDQENLNQEFTEGYSQNRYSERRGTLYTGWWRWKKWDGDHDKCGHGTSMSGASAAPLGLGYGVTGVAYQSNLLMVRAVEDVVISSSNEKKGVADALVLAGNRNDMHIISMSIGSPFSSGTVSDGIRYAYGKGKLIFAAGGTSFNATSWWGVIFPANMNETIAVTGVKETASLQKCGNCHKGSKIDFTYVMERSENEDRNQPSLTLTGENPMYVGGSSIATASTAGIAALVWSTDLGQTRAQIINRLEQASSHYPQGTSDYGYGNINAQQAVSLNP